MAELAGVSSMTVSRFLGGSEKVAEKTRQRISRAAEKLHYRPSPLASGLRTGKTRTIGIVWSLDSPHNTAEMVRRISNGAYQEGYVSHVIDSHLDTEVTKRILSDFAARRVEAVVLQSSDVEMERFLHQFPAAVMVTDRKLDVAMNQVHQDRLAAYRQTVEYLLQSGRKNVRFLGPGGGNDAKMACIIQVMHGHGSQARFDELHIDTNVIESELHRADPQRYYDTLTTYYNRSEPDFDALLCSTDNGASAACSWLAQRGLRVPEDVAVVGFNNSPMSSFSDPPLATIERNDDQVADEVDKMLFACLQDPERPPRYKKVSMEFVWRASAGGKGIYNTVEERPSQL